MGVPVRIAVDDETVALVRELCAALDSEAVRYCHWKSNAFLDRSSSGLNDLDLLVRRSDGDRFAATLSRLGFKEVAAAMRLPGVSSYYGYDAASEKFIHVHAHYRLIVGDDLTKNYHLPVEDAFLDSTTRVRDFPVPPTELEFILFVIRMMLKHSTWDSKLARRGEMSRSARAELAYLQARIDEELVSRALRRHFPFLDPEVFAACIRALDPQTRVWTRIHSGRRLLSSLSGCARRPRPSDVALKLWRRVRGTLRARVSRSPGKQLRRGGRIIAFVGADGAGKSTLVEGISAWLSTEFSVVRVHLGKPPRSWTTVALGAVLRTYGAAQLVLGRGGAWADKRERSRLRVLYAVATARDRYRAYTKARRAALGGVLVACDRFPLAQLKLMDAPRVEPAQAGGRRRRLAERLAALEQRYYRRILSPDVLIVLRVDPEVAVTRKPEEQPDFIRSRWREIWETDWEASSAHVVDAGRSPGEVLSEVKSLVWSEL